MMRLVQAIALILVSAATIPAYAQPATVRATSAPEPRIPIDPLANFVVPVLYDGGGYLSSLFLTNRDTAMLHFGIFFFAADGTPVSLPIEGAGPTTGIYIDIDVNQSTTLQTTGQSPQFIDAYALVFTFDRSAGDPAAQPASGVFSGMAAFSKNINGVLVEANEPVSSGFETMAAMPFDGTAGATTSVVLVNPDPIYATNVTLTVRDNAGNMLVQDVIAVPAGAKRFVNLAAAYGATVGQRGRVFLSGDGSFLSSIGLRANSTGAFSTILPWSVDSRLMQ